MRYTDYDIINKLDEFYDEISKAKAIYEEKLKDRKDWCRRYRSQFVKIFPKKNKLYKIKTRNKYVEPRFLKKRIDAGEDVTLYFKSNKPSFSLVSSFGHKEHHKYPVVEGDIYDDNLNLVYRNHLHCISELEEDDFCKRINGSNTKSFDKYVYVMHDFNTGYYKIGKSNNPERREKTLQSEKPTIELLYKSKMSVKTEKELHQMFQEKRIRGEWFDLTGSDITKLKKELNIS